MRKWDSPLLPEMVGTVVWIALGNETSMRTEQEAMYRDTKWRHIKLFQWFQLPGRRGNWIKLATSCWMVGCTGNIESSKADRNWVDRKTKDIWVREFYDFYIFRFVGEEIMKVEFQWTILRPTLSSAMENVLTVLFVKVLLQVSAGKQPLHYGLQTENLKLQFAWALAAGLGNLTVALRL